MKIYGLLIILQLFSEAMAQNKNPVANYPKVAPFKFNIPEKKHEFPKVVPPPPGSPKPPSIGRDGPPPSRPNINGVQAKNTLAAGSPQDRIKKAREQKKGILANNRKGNSSTDRSQTYYKKVDSKPDREKILSEQASERHHDSSSNKQYNKIRKEDGTAKQNTSDNQDTDSNKNQYLEQFRDKNAEGTSTLTIQNQPKTENKDEPTKTNDDKKSFDSGLSISNTHKNEEALQKKLAHPTPSLEKEKKNEEHSDTKETRLKVAPITIPATPEGIIKK